MDSENSYTLTNCKAGPWTLIYLKFFVLDNAVSSKHFSNLHGLEFFTTQAVARECQCSCWRAPS